MNLIHAFAALALAAAPVPGETLTNATIVALTSAGLGDDAIIAKIRSSDVRFDLSTEQMIDLKRQGVSGPVIAAMLSASSGAAAPATTMSIDSPDPMQPHPGGMYLLSRDAAGAKMVRMDATVSNQAKTGGLFGYALTGGIASMSMKAAIQNETARVSATGAPVFYLFFDEANGVGSSWGSNMSAVINSPNEFTLIHLDKKKGRREARVGSLNIAGAKTGVMDKDRLPFDYELVRPGVYKVAPRGQLKPGEYGFIYAITGSGGAAGAMTARIFDFSVR